MEHPRSLLRRLADLPRGARSGVRLDLVARHESVAAQHTAQPGLLGTVNVVVGTVPDENGPARIGHLETLEDRERDVVIMRFGLDGEQPRTLEQIGKRFGLSRERVRQIERETMTKLRDPQRADALRDYLG